MELPSDADSSNQQQQQPNKEVTDLAPIRTDSQPLVAPSSARRSSPIPSATAPASVTVHSKEPQVVPTATREEFESPHRKRRFWETQDGETIEDIGGHHARKSALWPLAPEQRLTDDQLKRLTQASIHNEDPSGDGHKDLEHEGLASASPTAPSPTSSFFSIGDRVADGGIDEEDLHRYEPGGYHPVHLGDIYNGRYKIVHKLGHGGFSTIWLAEDLSKSKVHRWVALKIHVAEESARVKESIATASKIVPRDITSFVATGYDNFNIEGPNGNHVCLVLPVCGPSLSELSKDVRFRLHPSQARRIAYLATQALAKLHAVGICHGDATTGNFVLPLTDLSKFNVSDIFDIFGQSETAEVYTVKERPLGSETPRYIVRSIDFLSTTAKMFDDNIVYLIDFDQSFPAGSPPSTMLGTATEWLAPEVAVGEKASVASDVWALACTIFRLRSGRTPFPEWFLSPYSVLMVIADRLNQDLPRQWQDILFDDSGMPTRDASTGDRLEKWGDPCSLRDIVYNVDDEPTEQSSTQDMNHGYNWKDRQPIPPHFAHLGWNPYAVAIDGEWLHGCDEKIMETIRDRVPKIPTKEADLLYDLLCTVFVYDPAQRPTARDLLQHPWFSVDT